MVLAGASLPPLPPGKSAKQKSAHVSDNGDKENKLEEWDPTAEVPESDDDEEALSGAPTAPHSEPGTAPASRQQKKRGKSISTIKNFHASLTEALRIDDERKAMPVADIYKTSGLQNPPAFRNQATASEDIFRSRRAVHNSPIIRAPPFPKAEGKAIRDAKNNTIKGALPSRPVCPHENCMFLDDAQHMKKFLHWCPQENMCDMRSDHEHLQYWLHSSDLAGKLDDQLAGWKKENKNSPFCVPHRAASMYQSHQPRVAFCPRGGHRPLGGNKCISTEFRELAQKEDQIPTDYVTLLLHGIEPNWNDHELLQWCKMHASPHAIIHVAKVTTRRGSNMGTGFVSFLCYDDAQKFANAVEGVGMANSKLHVEYARNERVNPDFEPLDNNVMREEKKRYAETITIARMNRLIKSCGPYALDVLSILERMKMEGLKPTPLSITHVLMALRDASPPQAERAERLLMNVCYEEYGEIHLNPHMVNIVIDAWCKCEGMKRAELLAQKMDEEEVIYIKPDQFEGTEKEKRFQYPPPNHETYDILTDGWARCGLMEEVGNLRTIFKPGDSAKAKSLVGSHGAVEAAASVIGTWSRRRSGFVGEKSSGMFVPRRNDKVKKGKGFGVGGAYKSFWWRSVY